LVFLNPGQNTMSKEKLKLKMQQEGIMISDKKWKNVAEWVSCKCKVIGAITWHEIHNTFEKIDSNVFFSGN